MSYVTTKFHRWRLKSRGSRYKSHGLSPNLIGHDKISWVATKSRGSQPNLVRHNSNLVSQPNLVGPNQIVWVSESFCFYWIKIQNRHKRKNTWKMMSYMQVHCVNTNKLRVITSHWRAARLKNVRQQQSPSQFQSTFSPHGCTAEEGSDCHCSWEMKTPPFLTSLSLSISFSCNICWVPGSAALSSLVSWSETERITANAWAPDVLHFSDIWLAPLQLCVKLFSLGGKKRPINWWPRLARTHTAHWRVVFPFTFYYIRFSWVFCLQPHEIGKNDFWSPRVWSKYGGKDWFAAAETAYADKSYE